MADLILKECIFYDSNCYYYGINNLTIDYGVGTSKSQMSPIGVLIHSTGVNQTKLARYVQPSTTDPNYDIIIADLGKNKNNNHWNKMTSSKCLHAMIGKNAAGVVEVYQTLPYNYCCWGCGTGSKGSYNYNPTPFLQYEILEDSLDASNPECQKYFEEAFGQAIAYTAYLCIQYGWDSSKVTSHYEANLAGYASGHKDPSHWLARFGKDMSWFRAEVQKIIDASKPSKDWKVGDILYFNGIHHYTNATAGTEKDCIGGKAYIKQIVKGKAHPYLVKHTEDNLLGTVDGWVNEEDMAPYTELPENKFEIGDKVAFDGDFYYDNFDDTATKSSAIKNAEALIISRVPMNYPHPYCLELKYGETILFKKWVDETDLTEFVVEEPNWEVMYKETITKLEEVTKKYEEDKAKIEQLQKINTQLQKEQLSLQSQLEATKATIAQVDQKNINLEDNIGVLKESLDKALAKNEEAREAIKTLINF